MIAAQTLLAIAARTAIVLAAVFAGVRVVGRRHTGEQRLDDILLVLLLSNAVQNAMTTGSGRLSVALVAAGTLLAAGWLTGALFRSRPALERQIGGAPTLLVHRGQVMRAHLEREELSDDELMAEIRKQGLHDVSDVGLAVLEPNGTISIVPREQDER